ncbi:hypothetical protein DYB28_012169, partial [Aphanomyces astaci]
FVHPTSKEVYVADWLGAARQKHVTDLQLALEEMHRHVAVRSDKLRQQARGRRDRKSQVKFAGFSVGDFVLVGSVVNRPTKLALHWRGPCQVTRVITDHVMETQQLVPPYEITVHHACRLKMYHEGGREVTEDLEAQIAFGDGGFHVERLDEARCVDGQHQVLVKWLGLGSVLQRAEQLGRALVWPIAKTHSLCVWRVKGSDTLVDVLSTLVNGSQ